MGQPTACAAGAGAGAAGAAGAGAAVAAAGAAAAAVTGAACWGCWTCTGEPLGSAMMLPEESRRTRRPADDLPLETSLPSPPTPLGRRTPSPPAAGASHEGRELGRPSGAEGGGSAGGGGEGRRRRPPRSPRACSLARAGLCLREGNRRPTAPTPLLAAGDVSPPRAARPACVCFRGPRPSLPGLPAFPAPWPQTIRPSKKMPPGDPEGGVVEPPPGSQIQQAPQLKRT